MTTVSHDVLLVSFLYGIALRFGLLILIYIGVVNAIKSFWK